MKTFGKIFVGLFVIVLAIYPLGVNAEPNYNPHVQCEHDRAQARKFAPPGTQLWSCKNICGYAGVQHRHTPQGVVIMEGYANTLNHNGPVYYPNISPYPAPPHGGYYGHGQRYPQWHDRTRAPAYPPYYDGYERAKQSGFNFFGLFYRHNQEVYREPRGK